VKQANSVVTLYDGTPSGSFATDHAFLVRPSKPWRADWSTSGLTDDGWTRPGRPATIRLYSDPGAPARAATVTALLDAPPEAGGPVPYRFGDQTGTIAPGTRGQPAQTVCIPSGGHADLTLDADGSAAIEGPPLGPTPGPVRNVGVAVSGMVVTDERRPC